VGSATQGGGGSDLVPYKLSNFLDNIKQFYIYNFTLYTVIFAAGTQLLSLTSFVINLSLNRLHIEHTVGTGFYITVFAALLVRMLPPASYCGLGSRFQCLCHLTMW
jgi:hypothetical protein